MSTLPAMLEMYLNRYFEPDQLITENSDSDMINNEAWQMIMFGKFRDAVAMMRGRSEQTVRLIQMGCASDKVAEIAVALIEEIVMRLMSKVKPTEVNTKVGIQTLKLLGD